MIEFFWISAGKALAEPCAVQVGGELTGDSLHAWCDGVQECFGGSGV